MVRFRRLAVLICAAAVAAAPGSAQNGVWRTGTTVPATAAAASHASACTDAPGEPRKAAAGKKRAAAAASFAPQRSQAELRNAAAAQIARMWARG